MFEMKSVIMRLYRQQGKTHCQLTGNCVVCYPAYVKEGFSTSTFPDLVLDLLEKKKSKI